VRVGVPRERGPGERRVALTPTVTASLSARDVEVVVEVGAGALAGHPDAAYTAVGAAVVAGEREAWDADLVVRVGPPTPSELECLPRGAAILGFLAPIPPADILHSLGERHATALTFEALPRISAAQAMDALSSQSTAVGYAAVLEAAAASQRFVPMLTTAAGTVGPARVLVLGAGVAGLQAMATARRLGAAVTGYDVRPEAAEQIDSLGARALRLDVEVEPDKSYARELAADQLTRLHDLLTPHVADTDVVITTAAVPGRRAPILITHDMVDGMRAGAVIVDAAVESGGNCEVTAPGERRAHGNGVIICGATNLASRVATDASEMYSRNVLALLQRVIVDGELVIDLDDDIVGGVCIVHRGQVRNQLTVHDPAPQTERGAFASPAAAATVDQTVRTATPEDVALVLAHADRVLIVPGYGLATARAHHDLARLTEELEARGVDVGYAIHPLAGRMPGHMDVLLAEAEIPHAKLLSLEEANERAPSTDVVLALGANDVVNPLARDDPGSPLHGMPIIEADRARSVVVVKRSLAPGYARIDNPLFSAAGTVLCFGDAK
jgi:H+-translocating NAD(P) transhydrogenase subunit alpha